MKFFVKYFFIGTVSSVCVPLHSFQVYHLITVLRGKQTDTVASVFYIRAGVQWD